MNAIDILNRLDRYNKHQFDVPFDRQAEYMSSLGVPKGLVDRSYKQFHCQQFFSPWWLKALWFVVSLVLLPVVTLLFLLKGRKYAFKHKVSAIAENKGMNEIIPEVLISKYDIHHELWNAGTGLSWADLKFMVKNCSFKNPYFLFKSVMQLAAFSPRIICYQPDAIIMHGEFSFCSSLLTEYCHSRGVKLINVMHGEKMRYIRDAFFQFDECYVWDMHYVDMLVELKAEPTQFRVAVPPSLKIDIEANQNKDAYADYKYYLAADNEEQIKSIVSSMMFAKKEGKTVKYRIHPRYTDLKVLKKYVSDDEIELPKNVSIVESVSNMDCAVGSYTTVLLQAYMSGKKVLLDDVTYKKRYYQLKEYGYILANKGMDTLSMKQR